MEYTISFLTTGVLMADGVDEAGVEIEGREMREGVEEEVRGVTDLAGEGLRRVEAGVTEGVDDCAA